MNIKDNWNIIRKHFSSAFKTSLHVAIASVDGGGIPTVTPIGSFFLNKDQSGFFFERFTSNLPANAESNKNVCVLGVNSGKWFWLKSVLMGNFSKHPAIKLYGTFGERRKATEQELYALKRRLRGSKNFKGHKLLWDKMDTIREIKFTRAEHMKLPVMTEGLI